MCGALFRAPRRARRAPRLRDMRELVAGIAAAGGELPAESAEQAITTVVRTFRDLVPDEARHVGAVLPAELRALWLGETTQ